MISSYDIAMRTIVDIPEHDIQALDRLCRKSHMPRAAAIRKAIEDYLRRHSPDSRDAAFGLWRDRHQDGLAYQHALRDEWSAPTIHEPSDS